MTKAELLTKLEYEVISVSVIPLGVVADLIEFRRRTEFVVNELVVGGDCLITILAFFEKLGAFAKFQTCRKTCRVLT